MMRITMLSFVTILVLKIHAVNIFDLTHEFSNNTIYWPSIKKLTFNLTNIQTVGNATSSSYYESNLFCAAEHGGTHLDAPKHFGYNKKTVSEIPVEDLIGPAFVVDVEIEASNNKDLLINVDHLKNAEKIQGSIPEGAILLLNTGWSKKWPNVNEYLGTDGDDIQLLHFPGLHPKAASWIVKNRKVKCVGIDTASIDNGQSTTFQSHAILSDANIVGLENVKDIWKIINKSTTVYALPMKIKHGSGSPVRIVAVEVEKDGMKLSEYFLIAVFALYFLYKMLLS